MSPNESITPDPMRLPLLPPQLLTTRQGYLLLFAVSVVLMLVLPRPFSMLPLAALLLLPLLSWASARLEGTQVSLRAADGRLLSKQRYLLFFGLCVVLMLLLPRDWGSRVLLLLVVVSGLALVPGGVWRFGSAAIGAIPVPRLSIPRRAVIALEIVIILAALFIATWEFRNFSPAMRLDGAELSYLLNSGVVASDMLREFGGIPLWNPFIGRGEPLFENPFSFLLNPLMSGPILWLGRLNGPKLAIFVHIMLMGLGAWCMAYMLRLRAPGRLFFALAMAGCGSMAGQIGYGFYQMGLSQAYVPWIFTGLLGCIERRDRWPVGLLAVSTTLMIFAGTFWYVMPAAVAAGLLTLFLLVGRGSGGGIALDRVALRRLIWAGLLILGLAAARLIPQLVHAEYVHHPRELLALDPDNFLTMFRLYFETNGFAGMSHRAIYYHYLLPGSFVVLLAGAWLLLRREIRARWRVLIPALLLLLGFTVWAQGGTEILRWLYETFTLLREWRYPPRMLAAGAPWLLLIVAICYDDVLLAAYRRARAALRWRRGLWLLLLAVMLLTGTWAVGLAVENWDRVSGVSPIDDNEAPVLAYLREQRPNEMLPVLTSGFFRYFPFYQYRIRVAFGNPDYRPAGIESTLGSPEAVDFPPAFAFGSNGHYVYDPAERGYRPLAGSVEQFGAMVWDNPVVPAYAFTLPLEGLPERKVVLTGAETTPIYDYEHQMDRIKFDFDEYPEDQVLVVQETAYPGWRVHVNRELAALQSLGGLLAVRLPGDGPAEIVFSYVPVWFYIGCLITILAVLVTAVYLLRLDLRWQSWQQRRLIRS